MGSSHSKDVTRLLGEDAITGSTIAQLDNDIVNFFTPQHKQQNYSKFCDRIVSASDPVGIIRQYTDHVTEHFARVNLSLAADSTRLATYADYIPELRASILSQPLLDDVEVFRGVELTNAEIAHMEATQEFFIPSFTSTSVDPTKAYQRSAIMQIQLPYACKYACTITEDLSAHYHAEREVLLSCYSAFRMRRVEKVNNTTILSLYLDEDLCALPSLNRFLA